MMPITAALVKEAQRVAPQLDEIEPRSRPRAGGKRRA
jgi:hypothetical protein